MNAHSAFISGLTLLYVALSTFKCRASMKVQYGTSNLAHDTTVCSAVSQYGFVKVNMMQVTCVFQILNTPTAHDHLTLLSYTKHTVFSQQ